MALPISPTPVIRGTDSKRFNAELKKSNNKRHCSCERHPFKSQHLTPLQIFVNLKDLLFTRLAEKNETKDFDCEDSDLNDFIRNDAWNYQKELLSVTYLFEDKQGTVVAFFSVSNDSLKDADYEKWNNLSRKVSNRKRRRDYPAVKIGRIGVDSKYKGNKLGTDILFFIKNWFTTENKTGCRFVLVDAYNNQQVINFYQKNEFVLLTEKDSEKKTRSMYFDLLRMIP
jgi:GNAT superfamily N-acetyltransferase